MLLIDIIANALKGMVINGVAIDVNYINNPKQADKRSDPFITYIDISEVPDFSANDVEISRTFYFDVDVMTKKPYLLEQIKKEVEKRLESVGFDTLAHASTDFGEEGIAHKPLSFRITKLKEEIDNGQQRFTK